MPVLPRLIPRGSNSIPAEYFAEVRDYLRSITPQPSGDILVETTLNGSTFRLRKTRGRSGGDTDQEFPFQVSRTGGTAVEVSRGLVNGFEVVGANFELPPSETNRIWVEAIIALLAVTSAEIKTSPTVGTIANWQPYPYIGTTIDDAAAGKFPNRRYVLIATVVTNETNVESIQQEVFSQIIVPVPVFTGPGCYTIS